MAEFAALDGIESIIGPDPFDTITDVSRCTPKQIGTIGERYAAAYLIGRGHELVEMNWTCPFGEVDIITKVVYEDGDETFEEYVLTEVKTRKALGANRDEIPELAVNARKRQKYRKLALAFTVMNSDVHTVRFDVIAVNVHGYRELAMRHLVGAYTWDEQ